MRIIRNNDTRLMFGVFLCAIAGVLILGGVLIHYRRQLNSYVEVDATLEGVIKESGQTTETRLELFCYASYSYYYEGREYSAQRQILSSIGYRAGEKTTLRINPTEPSEIENILMQKACIFGIIVCTVFIVLECGGAIRFLKNIRVD